MKATATAQAVALLVGVDDEGLLADIAHTLGFDPCLTDVTAKPVRYDDPVAVCFVDLKRHGEALRAVRLLRTHYPDAVVLGIADPERPSLSAEAIRAGAFDVVSRPLGARDVAMLLANAREQQDLKPSAPARPEPPLVVELAGTSAAMRSVSDLIVRAAPGRSGILICGEPGTGREAIARAIHVRSRHANAAFVPVDCSREASDDLELELFGVVHRRPGNAPERRSVERIQINSRLFDAVNGSLFFANLVDMPARVQSRLARIVRDGEVVVGSERQPLRFNGRLMAAVDGSIELAVSEGRLRSDLFERLAGVRIEVPPLRMRREDIPVLATSLLKDVCRTHGRPVKSLTRAALTLLSALPLRGNVPELRALLERLVDAVPHGLIRLEDVLAHTELEGRLGPTGGDATLRQARARFERDYIGSVLQQHHGRIAEAARTLGIQRTNLYRKMRRLNLVRGRAVGRSA